ncbi:MAG: hypothetical protein ACI9C4_001605 [Paraglaciecola sp.]|jgi:hypothetical protein
MQENKTHWRSKNRRDPRKIDGQSPRQDKNTDWRGKNRRDVRKIDSQSPRQDKNTNWRGKDRRGVRKVDSQSPRPVSSNDWQGKDRRKRPLVQDKLYQVIIGINIVGWMVLIAALLVFHYARPEFIIVVQDVGDLTGRARWSNSLSFYLICLLVLCVSLSTVFLLLRRRRTRRQNDHFGINGFVLFIFASISLTILYFKFN